MKTAKPKVTCVGATDFWFHAVDPKSIDYWKSDAYGGSALVEFAGRACYQSWTKPNPTTAANRGYIEHILRVGHLSVLEHASVSFYLEGVSRSFTHELIRHRHLSFSQLSQRYVNEADAKMVIPAEIADDPNLLAEFAECVDDVQNSYKHFVEQLNERYADVTDKTLRRKMARQAARAILPNATETKIVVTGNLRAWRHFINMRATEHADVEIRHIAILVLRKLMYVNPAVFADYTITTLDDGTEVASSPFVVVS